MTGRTMQENWSLGQRRSSALDLLTGKNKKEDIKEETDDEKMGIERARSVSLGCLSDMVPTSTISDISHIFQKV